MALLITPKLSCQRQI